MMMTRLLVIFLLSASQSTHAFSFRSPSSQLLASENCLYAKTHKASIQEGRIVIAESKVIVGRIEKIGSKQVEWTRFQTDEPNLRPLVLDVEVDDDFVTAYLKSNGSSQMILLCKK
jgi:hypothetical protein